MTTKPSVKKDWLDYLDIIVKIVSGGLLAFVLGVLNHTNQLKQQEIANSIKYGEFTKALMTDLLTTDSTHFRSDIALITLNRTIGDDNKQLVADIGTRLIENFMTGKVHSDVNTMRSILAIIKERDSISYNMAMRLIAENNAKPRVNTGLEKLNKQDTAIVVNSITDQSWAKITLVQAPAIVFMQVNKNTPDADEKTNKLQALLKTNKFTVPAKEVITAYTFKNMVRFYYEEDRRTAEKVASLSKIYLKDTIAIVKLNSPKARKGLIELWCNY